MRMRAALPWLLLVILATPAFADGFEGSRIEQGEKLRQEKRYKEAATEYQEAHRLAPEPLLLLDIAACYRLAGDLKEARSFLERYLTEEPRSPFRGEVERQLEALKKAQKAKKPLDVSGDEAAAGAAYTTGDTAYKEKRYPEAASGFATAYLFKPAPLLLFNLAQTYRFAEDTANARLYYQRFVDRIPEAPELPRGNRSSAPASPRRSS
jgi:tetratricopeptide (TPR) repeat protein